MTLDPLDRDWDTSSHLPVFLSTLCTHVYVYTALSGELRYVYCVVYSARLHEVIYVLMICDQQDDNVITQLASGTST